MDTCIQKRHGQDIQLEIDNGYFSSAASQVALVVKNLPANTNDSRDAGWIPGLGRSPGEGNGNPLQYSCLENSMDKRVGPWGHKE